VLRWRSCSGELSRLTSNARSRRKLKRACRLFEAAELTHSTGHAKRLAREGFDTPQKFGSESYSREELIAEMGSAMLCGVAGIEQSTLANSAAYLKAWIARLKSDSRLVVSAASAAQKAADYIGGSLRKPPPAIVGECHAS
jgi:antirestriction protein ArdC